MICEWEQGHQQAPVAACPVKNNKQILKAIITKQYFNLQFFSHQGWKLALWQDNFVFLDNKKNVSYPGKLAKYQRHYSISKLAFVSVST